MGQTTLIIGRHMSNYSNYLSTFDLQPFQLVWYMKNINNSDNYATKWDVLCTFNGFKQSVGCFVRGGRNGMGCFVRGGKSGMECFVRGDKNCMGCFVRGGKLMRDVLSGVLKNGMGCYVPGCFVLNWIYSNIILIKCVIIWASSWENHLFAYKQL